MFISLSLSVGRSVEQVLCVLKPLTPMLVTDVAQAWGWRSLLILGQVITIQLTSLLDTYLIWYNCFHQRVNNFY